MDMSMTIIEQFSYFYDPPIIKKLDNFKLFAENKTKHLINFFTINNVYRIIKTSLWYLKL